VPLSHGTQAPPEPAFGDEQDMCRASSTNPLSAGRRTADARESWGAGAELIDEQFGRGVWAEQVGLDHLPVLVATLGAERAR
jgi:hypothetical protein